MKILFLLLLSGTCIAQGTRYKEALKSSSYITAGTVDTQWDAVYNFDALNAAKITEAVNARRYAIKADSVKWLIVRQMLQIKTVDFSRISEHPDSLKVTSEGIFLKLKSKKK